MLFVLPLQVRMTSFPEDGHNYNFSIYKFSIYSLSSAAENPQLSVLNNLKIGLHPLDKSFPALGFSCL